MSKTKLRRLRKLFGEFQFLDLDTPFRSTDLDLVAEQAVEGAVADELCEDARDELPTEVFDVKYAVWDVGFDALRALGGR